VSVTPRVIRVEFNESPCWLGRGVKDGEQDITAESSPRPLPSDSAVLKQAVSGSQFSVRRYIYILKTAVKSTIVFLLFK